MRKLRLGRLALVAAAIGLVAAAALPPTGAGATTKIIKPSRIFGSGSDTTYNMMAALDTLYNNSAGCNVIAPVGTTQPLNFKCLPDDQNTIHTENYPHDVVSEGFPLGSSVGVNQLCQQGLTGVANINFARSSRTPRLSDCTHLHFVAYARDGISWEAFPGVANSAVATMNNQAGACAGSSGFCLTQQQLKDIFLNCTITNWNQVGGANAPIVIYTQQNGSGTRASWDGFVGGNTQTCIPQNQLATHVIPENHNNVILSNGDAANAIFGFSFGDYQKRIVPNPDGSQLGAVDGVTPTAVTIGDGTFPFGRFLFNVFCGAASSSTCGTAKPAGARTKAYIAEKGWLCKLDASHGTDPQTGDNYRDEIAATISSQGFIPLPSGAIGGGATGSDYCRLFTT
jgi:ABC-type phosphate transport system substrate-binding protein